MVFGVGEMDTHLDGHSYGLELERVRTLLIIENNVQTCQVDHRLLLNRPMQHRNREFRMFVVCPLGGNLRPNLGVVNIARAVL